MSAVLGIDLGTTNSAMAIIENGQARIIPNAEGANTTPSVVGYTTETDCVVGQAAYDNALVEAKNTVSSVKRFIGVRYSESTSARAGVSYDVIKSGHDDIRIRVKTRERSIDEILAQLRDKTARDGLDLMGGSLNLSGVDGELYAPEQISAQVLKKLKRDAELYLGEPVTEAVITVPAYFDDSQRQATRTAGRLAGLDVMRIIAEPTAASLAYGIGSPDKDETCMIFDLGGGTFDVSILRIERGVFTVLSTYGDNRLGGDDWDNRLMVWIAERFSNEFGPLDLLEDPVRLQRIRAAAVKAKIELSSCDEALIELPEIYEIDGEFVDFSVSLTRKQFEDMCRLLNGRLMIPMEQALKGAGLKASDLDEVVLVGGSTRMPSVRKLVERKTGLRPCEGVNPDEAVALGAAIQAGLLTGDVEGVSFQDVTPLSLGVRTAGNVMDVLIPRNTAIPTHVLEIYETTEDNQESVSIEVFQGERMLASDNHSLGTFKLEGLPRAPKGKVKIEVGFAIDANGVVNVSARETKTGLEQQIYITGGFGLSEEEIQRMLLEAQEQQQADDDALALAKARQEAQDLLHYTLKGLARYASRLSNGDEDAIKAAAMRLEGHLDANSCLHQLEHAVEDLRAVRAPLEQAAEGVDSNAVGWYF